MANSENEFIVEDEFDRMLRTATNDMIKERGLADTVRLSEIAPQIDSDHYVVGLKQKTGRSRSSYYSFYVDPAEALTAVGGGYVTVDAVKGLVRREMMKIFPDSATH